MINWTKRFVGAWSIVALAGSTGMGAGLNISVTSDGNDTVIVVPCGGIVTYEVAGLLSDTQNKGLAGFLIDLAFNGGPLQPADTPVADPMLNFDRPAGITGPDGFGGVVVGGQLLGVGGAQNTIKNTVDNAPFPIGEVVTGVAHTDAILVTGSFTAPAEPGTYILTVSALAATVIVEGEDGSGVVWATEPAGVGDITSLTVVVPPVEPPAAASNNGPVCNGDDVTLFGGPDGMTSYQWTGPAGFESTAQNPVISPAVHGTYALIVTDTNDCIDVARTTVAVVPASCQPWMDCNNNGRHDECDLLYGASEDCNANAVPDECETIGAGDFDGDGDIDLTDYGRFFDCDTGPCTSPPCDPPMYGDPCCRTADLDNDGDVDVLDFRTFQTAFTGPLP